METHQDLARSGTTPAYAASQRRPDPQTVNRLVQRARAGDHEAFTELLSAYRSLLRHILWRRLREPADVMDVLQETMLRAYRGIARFRGECSFATWIGRIATNSANTYLERQARHDPRPRPRSWPSPGSIAVDEERHEEVLADHDTPEDHAARAEFWDSVGAGLARLPLDMRTALTLCDIHGMSYHEIARTAHCPIGTVRSRIFRARRAMQELMRDTIEP